MIFIILLLGLLLRITSLDQSLWIDEATSANASGVLSWKDFFNVFMPTDFHPPSYYIVLKFWAHFFGTSEIMLRLPSVLFGLGTIYLVYKIARELDFKLPLVPALLLATSGLHVYYSQEARMYSMAIFLVTLSVLYFLKILKKGRMGDWIIFSSSIFLVVSTDYLLVLIIPCFWLIALLTKKDGQWWVRFIMSHIILFIFAISWAPIFYSQLTGGVRAVSDSPIWANILGKLSVKNILLIPIKFMIGRVSIDNNYFYALAVFFSGLIFGLPLVNGIRRLNIKHTGFLAWLWLVIPLLIGIGISLFIPVLSYFRFIFVIPAFYILVGKGIEEVKNINLQRIFLISALSINLIFSLSYLLNPKFHREGWKSFVEKVMADKRNSYTVFPADSQMEAYTYYRNKYFLSPQSGPKGVPLFFKKLNEEKPADKIWLVRYVAEVFDPKDEAKAEVERLGYSKISEENFNGVVVWEYGHDKIDK